MRFTAFVSAAVALMCGAAWGQAAQTTQIVERDITPLLQPVSIDGGQFSLGVVEPPQSKAPEPPKAVKGPEPQAILDWLAGSTGLSNDQIASHATIQGNKLTLTGDPQWVERALAVVEPALAMRGRMVTIEVRWVAGRWQDLESASPVLAAQIRSLSVPGSLIPGLLIDETDQNQIISAIQRDAASTTVTAPRLTLYNGQEASLTLVVSRYVEPNNDAPQGADLVSGIGLHARGLCLDPTAGTLVEVRFEHAQLTDFPPKEPDGNYAFWPPSFNRHHRQLIAAIPPGRYLVSTLEGGEDPERANLLMVSVQTVSGVGDKIP